MLKLDDRDIRILSVLSRDGRLPKADLARAVHAACGAPAPSAPRPTWADRAATLLRALAARMEVSP